MEWTQKTDPMFEMDKEQYKMSKEWAAMRYKANPKYLQAKY